MRGDAERRDRVERVAVTAHEGLGLPDRHEQRGLGDADHGFRTRHSSSAGHRRAHFRSTYSP